MRESRNILTLILDSEITRYVQNLLLERSHSVLTKSVSLTIFIQDGFPTIS